MKKLIILLFAIFAIQANIKADDDKLIQFTELPQQAQTFVSTHFDKKAVTLVKMETDYFDRSYEVIFSNGIKIEFDKKGNWEEVDCRYTALPQSAVPVAIRNYVAKHYPNTNIIKMEREDRGRIEVSLSNDLDLTFDSKFNLVDIDD